jgi:hypothetical protein
LVKRLRLLFILLLLFALLLAERPVSAEDTKLTETVTKDVVVDEPTREKIRAQDTQILLELIKLGRFNIHFHEEANRRYPWRSALYPLAQEAGTALSLSNTLTDLTERARALEKPRLLSRPALQKGAEVFLVGTAINGTSSFLELAQNEMVILRATKEGYSPEHAELFVKSSLDKVDRLLVERAKLTDTFSDDRRYQIVDLDGRLLKHVRDQLLYQFSLWSIASREKMWRENTFFAIDTVQAYVNFSSGFLSLKTYTDRRYTGPAALVSLISNAIVVVNPFIRDYVGRISAQRQTARLAREFKGHRPRTMQKLYEDWQGFQPYLDQSKPIDDASLKQEVHFISRLAQESRDLDQGLAYEEKHIEKLRRVADQQAIAGPIIGMFSVARSTSATVAYYGFRGHPNQANGIYLAGRCSQTTGQAYSLYATAHNAFENFKNHQRLKKAGNLPSQILANRLGTLDALEKSVRDSQF